VIDLLGRTVYTDLSGIKPKFYVVAIGQHDEWDCGSFESYKKAVDTATEEWEHRTPNILEVEIRLYVNDIEEEDCPNFDFNTITFK
jgi:hypothetical protein